MHKFWVRVLIIANKFLIDEKSKLVYERKKSGYQLYKCYFSFTHGVYWGSKAAISLTSTCMYCAYNRFTDRICL